MKVYIMTDLEGAWGVDKKSMVSTDSPDYPTAVSNLLSDINAAIDGAFLGGATEVWVRDGHGGGRNFTAEDLDPRAKLDTTPNWRDGVIDESFSAIFTVGAHAMSGTQNAFYDHTQSSETWHDFTVNGRRWGELAQYASVAGHYRIPMVFVSGDEAACAEARRFFAGVCAVPVKNGLRHTEAESYPFEETRENIRIGAKKSMSLITVVKPFRPLLPMEITLELNRTEFCDWYEGREDVERLDGRTVRRVVNDMRDVYI